MRSSTCIPDGSLPPAPDLFIHLMTSACTVKKAGRTGAGRGINAPQQVLYVVVVEHAYGDGKCTFPRWASTTLSVNEVERLHAIETPKPNISFVVF